MRAGRGPCGQECPYTKVVIGFVDPDLRMSGGGIMTLLDAGIEVVVGCEEESRRAINADFIARNTK